MPRIEIDPRLVERYVLELAAFGEVGATGVSRTVYSPAWVAAADCYAGSCRDAGLAVRRNEPYAGGYVTRHYGRPREGVHALQIELARGLYMDEARIERGPGFAALERALARLIEDLAGADWSALRP